MAYSQRSLCHHPSAFRKSISLRLFTIDHFTKSPYPDEEFLHLAFLVFVECTAGLRERCGRRGLGGEWGAKAWWKPYLAYFYYLQLKTWTFTASGHLCKFGWSLIWVGGGFFISIKMGDLHLPARSDTARLNTISESDSKSPTLAMQKDTD